MASVFDLFTKKKGTDSSENLPYAFSHIVYGAPMAAYISMVAGNTFDEAMQETNSLQMLDDEDLFTSPEDEDPDAVEKAIYQLNIAKQKGIEPSEVFQTPYGPALSGDAIDQLLDEYPNLDSGIDLDDLNENFEFADRILNNNDATIESAMDAGSQKATDEGNIEETGEMWKVLGDNLGNAVEGALRERFLTPDDPEITSILEGTAGASQRLLTSEDQTTQSASMNLGDSALLGQDNQPDPIINGNQFSEVPPGVYPFQTSNLDPNLSANDQSVMPETDDWDVIMGGGPIPEDVELEEPDTMDELGFDALDTQEPIDQSLINRYLRGLSPGAKTLFQTLQTILLKPDEDTGAFFKPQEVIEYLDQLGRQKDLAQGVDHGRDLRSLLLTEGEHYDQFAQEYVPYSWNILFAGYRGGDAAELYKQLMDYANREESGKGEKGRAQRTEYELTERQRATIDAFKKANPDTTLTDQQILAEIQRREVTGVEAGAGLRTQEEKRIKYRAENRYAPEDDAEVDALIAAQERDANRKILEDEEKIRAFREANPDTNLTDAQILEREEDTELTPDQNARIEKQLGPQKGVGPQLRKGVATAPTPDGTPTTGGMTELDSLITPSAIELKEPGELDADKIATENLYSTFFKTVYAYPESGRSDVQQQLPYIFNDTKMLFFLWGGLDAYGTQQQAIATLDDDVRTKALGKLENNYRIFVEEYLRDPESKRAGMDFSKRMALIGDTLEYAANNPNRETWDDTFRNTHIWVDALFGPDSNDGDTNRSTLLKISASRGGRGYYSSLIHGAVDRAMTYYQRIGWTPEQIFKRMSYLTNLPAVQDGTQPVDQDVPAVPAAPAAQVERDTWGQVKAGPPPLGTLVSGDEDLPTTEEVQPLLEMPEDLLLNGRAYEFDDVDEVEAANQAAEANKILQNGQNKPYFM